MILTKKKKKKLVGHTMLQVSANINLDVYM